MRATNLSISVPNYGCKKNCPYCISKMTGYVEKNFSHMLRNAEKVKSIAKQAQVSSVSFTSKGEILDAEESRSAFIQLIKQFKDDFACEIQTNGDSLDIKTIQFLYNHGIDTVAISIDNFIDIPKLQPVFEAINYFGMTIRLTVNLLPETYDKHVSVYFDFCKAYNVHQISFRSVTTPSFSEVVKTAVGKKTYNWIRDNVSNAKTYNFLKEYKLYLEDNGRKIRQLPYGAALYNVGNISTTYFEYCIQDGNSEQDIRSLIFYEDGHLATTWYGSNYGRIL